MTTGEVITMVTGKIIEVTGTIIGVTEMIIGVTEMIIGVTEMIIVDTGTITTIAPGVITETVTKTTGTMEATEIGIRDDNFCGIL